MIEIIAMARDVSVIVIAISTVVLIICVLRDR